MEDDAVLFLRKPLFSALFFLMPLNGMERHLHLVLVWCLLILMFMFYVHAYLPMFALLCLSFLYFSLACYGSLRPKIAR